MPTDATPHLQSAQSTHFRMGTSQNPAGRAITADAASLLLDGKRWLPVMGEFHYSRYPQNEWFAELLKMKAGGIDLIATYVFWIHHEEAEGEWNWSGRRDLRTFVQLCSQAELPIVIRCGPWCHGEVRNGGLPDWLLDKNLKLRSDDPAYLQFARSFYGQIAKQLTGLLWKDGGPVIGIQIENEYGGPGEHLVSLKRIAEQIGLDVPIYTRTGWPALSSPIPFGEILPLNGGYPEGFWDRDLTPMPGKYWTEFTFSLAPLDLAVATDHFGQRDAKPDETASPYPYLTCELGGGMMCSYHRRIRLDPRDVHAIPLVKVGSGSNLPGYYMYHGGTNPDSTLTTLNEAQNTRHTNYNDLPVKTYDFAAPLGEFGQVRPHYHLLRLLHLFLRDFGPTLASMPAVLPKDLPTAKDDSRTLRWSVRRSGQSGFVFVSNYQRLLPMPAKPDVQFDLSFAGIDATVPARPITVPADSSFFWPVNLDLGHGAILSYATAQPICHVDSAGTRYTVFAEIPGIATEFVFQAKSVMIESTAGQSAKSGDLISITAAPAGTSAAVQLKSADGHPHCILLLDANQSLACWKGKLAGEDRIVLSSANLSFDGNTLRTSSDQPEAMTVSLLPAPSSLSLGQTALPSRADGLFKTFTLPAAAPSSAKATADLVQPAGPLRTIRPGSANVAEAPTDADFAAAAVWRIRLAAIPPDRKLLLRIRYVGDVARLYLNGEFLLDHFYNGTPFDLGLHRFTPAITTGELLLKILPLQKDAPLHVPTYAKPNFGPNSAIVILQSVELIELYEYELTATERNQ